MTDMDATERFQLEMLTALREINEKLDKMCINERYVCMLRDAPVHDPKQDWGVHSVPCAEFPHFDRTIIDALGKTTMADVGVAGDAVIKALGQINGEERGR